MDVGPASDGHCECVRRRRHSKLDGWLRGLDAREAVLHRKSRSAGGVVIHPHIAVERIVCQWVREKIRILRNKRNPYRRSGGGSIGDTHSPSISRGGGIIFNFLQLPNAAKLTVSEVGVVGSLGHIGW